ncbi:MAG: carboxypeptidase regulatory-like domain-containing protein [Candidatus Brocadia sp.]
MNHSSNKTSILTFERRHQGYEKHIFSPCTSQGQYFSVPGGFIFALNVRQEHFNGISTPQLAGGGHHSLALKPDGTVWAWGQNDFGQLGNGTTSDSTIPVQVLSVPGKTDNFSGATAITGGWSYSVALKSDSTVWAWGRNDFGQLGNGTTSDSTVPVQVSNLSGVLAIAGGGFHSLGLKSDGTVWAWGDNSYGQLGNGTTSNSTVPVQVKNLSGIVVIAGGGFHSLGLKSDGTVWAWGRNDFGQLGDGTTKDSTIPVQVFINLSIETGNIAGVVQNAITGTGINNATVMLDDQSNTTTTSSIRGKDGVYKFQDVSVGDHTLIVQANGFQASTQSVTVQKGQPNPKTGKNIFIIVLSPITGTPTPTPGTGNLGGQVTDAETDAGIVGATVSTDTGLTTTTVKNGAYAFRNIAAGDYTLTASATGYISASKSATVVAGENTRVDFVLTTTLPPTPIPTPPSTPIPETGNLGGQITDAVTGVGIVGATVSADTGLTTTTVKNGIYTFRDIIAGDYILTAFATGYDLASQSATVVVGKNTRVDFALTPQTTPIPTPTGTPSETGNIVGAVTDDETGAGIVGATVSTDTGLTTATIINGAYAFRNIATGDYILTASASGYITASQLVTVVAGETIRADFELIPGTPTPTPLASPIPTPLCQAGVIEASPKTMQLNKGKNGEETITVLCADGSPLAGETITWKIKSGKRRITITPDSSVTDTNGEARFTITTTEKTGEAKIKFEDKSAGLKTTVTVRVRQ